MSYNPYAAKRRQFGNNGPSITPTSTYAGEAADFYVAPAIHGADTIANGWVTQLDGIQNKAVVSGALVDATGLLQAGTANCDFTDGNNVTVDERVLTLTDLKVNEELCRSTILPTWQGMTGARQSMDWSNDKFRNFVIATVAAKTAQQVENAIWKGGAVSGFKGFLSNDGTFNAAADLAAGTLAGATTVDIATITNANAIGQFNLVYTKMADTTPAVLTLPDVAFYVSPKTYAAYCQQLAGLGAGSFGYTTSGSTVVNNAGQGINNQGTAQSFLNVGFMGIPIHVSGGMFNDAIVMTTHSNLFVGSNLRTDYAEASYIPVYQFDGSDNVRVAMRFGLGTQSGRAVEAVVGATWVG